MFRGKNRTQKWPADCRQIDETYRSRSRLWNFPSVLPPLRVLHLHVRPLKHLLHIWEGVLADSRSFDILPEKQTPTPETHPGDTLRINDSLGGYYLRSNCHPDQISNTSQIIRGQWQAKRHLSIVWKLVGVTVVKVRLLRAHFPLQSLTGMWFSHFITRILQKEIFVLQIFQHHTHPSQWVIKSSPPCGFSGAPVKEEISLAT